LLGPDLLKRFQIIDHDCLDKDNLVRLGTTSRGTPVIINRVAAEADHLVLTGCCTYHPWVGWAAGKIYPARNFLDRVHPKESFNDHG